MRQIVYTFIIILLGLYALLNYLGGDSQYQSEKVLWHINKKFDETSKDPNATPDATYDKIIRRYEEFIEKFEGSNLVPTAHLLVARVHIVKKEYALAREKYNETIKLYPDIPDLAAQALSEIATTYLLEENIPEVIKHYNRILDEYALTDLGMKMPVVISKFYADRNNVAMAKKSFDDALLYYKDLIEKNPGTVIEFNAYRMITACYMAQSNWKDAIMAQKEILLKFADLKSMNVQQLNAIIKTINTVSVTQLRDFELPISIYEEFIEKFPKHPLNKLLKEVIRSLKELSAAQEARQS